ncbi:MAG: RraA family protein [Actinomycetota bacterium]|nr:RraA family protein [Actinomycetota bacterium]
MGNDYFDNLAGRLYAAVISDVLDAAGYREQAMGARITHHAGGGDVLVGRAATILAGEEVELRGDPYALQIEAIDGLKEGDVVVATTHDSHRAAFWGELFSTAAVGRGARGLILDGLMRDRRKVDEMGFPVFATGARPVDSMGRLTVYAHGVPVRCGGVTVRPGDLVFAEPDGIVVVPAGIEEEVVAAALEKVDKEDLVRSELAGGASLAEAWARHRVL